MQQKMNECEDDVFDVDGGQALKYSRNEEEEEEEEDGVSFKK